MNTINDNFILLQFIILCFFSMMANGHLRNSDSQDKLTADIFDEASKGNDSTQKALEQEAVRSLLNLSALGEPSQWSTSTGNFI